MTIQKHYGISIGLDDIVFHDEIYDGKEPMKVVGLRKKSVELEGDFSGGTHNVSQTSWLPIEKAFKISKRCEHKDDNGQCHRHIYCLYPACEPYLKSLPDNKGE